MALLDTQISVIGNQAMVYLLTGRVRYGAGALSALVSRFC